MSREQSEQRMIATTEKRLREQADSVARSLRDLADAVERAMKTRDFSMATAQWSWRAHTISHQVAWGVANLNIDRLTLTAAELDVLIATYPAAGLSGSKGENPGGSFENSDNA